MALLVTKTKQKKISRRRPSQREEGRKGEKEKRREKET